MRSLQRCDFCGADPVGTFEVLPPELDPDDAEQRRVLLCADCKRQLDALLEPLFDRLDADASTSRSGGEAADDVGGNGDATEPDEEPPDTDEEAANVDEEAVDADEEVAVTNEETANTDEESAVTDEEAGVDETTDGSGEEAADGVGDRASVDATDRGNRPPNDYGKVVRLLRNREFPMERSAVESLAAGAYDLEPREVEAIVEYAIAEGEFREEGEQLVRT